MCADNFYMDIQEVRRRRLKEWLDDKFPGKRQQKRFIADVAQRLDEDINQGELSALLGTNKSFAEKKARNLERLGGMPDKWLDGDPAETGASYLSSLADAVNDPVLKELLAFYGNLSPELQDKLRMDAQFYHSLQHPHQSHSNPSPNARRAAPAKAAIMTQGIINKAKAHARKT